MTERNGFQIAETKVKIFERDNYRCGHCGLSIFRDGTPQCAHRIAQTESNIKKYGASVIHHELNLVSTCSLYCNGHMNIGYRTAEAEELADKIRDAMLGE